jgi:hypothetical protein
LVLTDPRVVVQYFGGVALGLEFWFRSRSGAGGFRDDKGSCLDFPMQEAVGIRVDLLVALDTVAIEAHTVGCLY